MKRLYVLLIPLALASCELLNAERGNGIRETRTFEVEEFSSVDIAGNFDVILQPGTKPLVTVDADENLFEFIRVRSKGANLEIEADRALMSRDGIEVVINYTELDVIVSSGASKIIAEEAIETDRLRLVMSGAGKTELNIASETVNLDLSGAGMIHLSGKTEELSVFMSGAGSLEAYELETDDCELAISGVGTAYVNVNGELVATVSGVGGVEYIGEPEHITQDVSGVGTIKKGRN